MRVQEVLGNSYYADAPAQRIGYLGARTALVLGQVSEV